MSKKEKIGVDWRTMDMRQAVTRDLEAAIGLLIAIKEHPHILDAVVVEMEKLKASMIENERMQAEAEKLQRELNPELFSKPVE